ncbi:hypothetical protein [Specibacter sp. RAF43]|uniref:hypothetical protein n=1 Tax=Specibacter sp. RAF43 TaxID=3233057 RepID=UPI003F97EC06
MRSFASALFVIIALLLAAAAGPGIWVERNVVQEAGFVDLAAPLGSNADFQHGLLAMVAAQTSAHLDLPPQLGHLAAGVISSTAGALASEPGYPGAWAQTLRRSHALTFAPAGGAARSLTLDISPMVALAAAKVSGRLGVQLPAPATKPIVVDQPAVSRALPMLATLGAAAGWLGLAAVVLFALAVAAARRRSLPVLWAGLGLAGVALAWELAARFASAQLSRIGAGNDVANQFGEQLGQMTQASWHAGITATFIAAGVLVVAGVVGLMVGRRPTT